MKYLICVILAVCCQQSITLDVHSQQHIPISPNQDYLSNKSSEQGGEGGSRGGDEDDMFEFTNKIAEKYIWKTVPVFFLILGTVANILSIIVFTRKEMIKFSSFVYFAFLNGVNLAVLYVTMIRIISEYFDTDIRSISVFTCKAHVFLTYFLGHLSSMLLCMISIDRVISVLFLHRAKVLCTPRVASWTFLALVVLNFLLSSHFLIFDSGYVEYTYISGESGAGAGRVLVIRTEPLNLNDPVNQKLQLQGSRVVCSSIENTLYNHITEKVWKLVDMSIFAFIPFVIMLICSVIIIGRVAQQSKKFKKKRTNSTAGNGAVPHHRAKSSPVGFAQQQQENFNSRTRNLALMLIPVNVLFLLFLAPVVLCMYFYPYLERDRLTLAIVELISYCNFTVNFFIYFLTSSKFREEFYKMLNEHFPRLMRRVNSGRGVEARNSICAHHQVNQVNRVSRVKSINKTEAEVLLSSATPVEHQSEKQSK